MVQISTLFAILALSSPLTLAVPLRRRQQLSDDDLLQNGLEAQKLNAAFQTINPADSCTNDDIACVGGALAICRDNSWVTQDCPATLQCFAIPDVDQEGVTIGCTSADTAAGLIEATGAQGGVNSTDFNSTTTDDGSFNNSTDNGVTTVTVTVTLPADGETQTLPASTATLTPDQAGSVISLAGAPAPTDPADPTDPAVAVANADGATTIILGGGAPAPTTPPTANDNVQGGLGGASSGTTIILNASTPTTTPDAAAAAAPTPDAAPAPAAPAGGSSGYY